MENQEENKSEPIDIPKKKKTQDIKEYMKQYKEDNKVKLNEKMKEKHICITCGGKYTTSGKYLHTKTFKHQRSLAQEYINDNNL